MPMCLCIYCHAIWLRLREDGMTNLLKRILNDETGSECIEMALVTASIAIGSITSFEMIKDALHDNVTGMSVQLDSVFDQ